jgi:hypothetical protein
MISVQRTLYEYLDFALFFFCLGVIFFFFK